MLKLDDIGKALKSASIDVSVELEEHLDSSFEDVGLDSLDIFNLFLELETITGKVVPDSDIDSLLTIADILKYHS